MGNPIALSLITEGIFRGRHASDKELKSKGVNIRKASTGACLLHPQYVVDYEKETGIVLTTQDKGFGNTIYKTGFKNLYSYDIVG